MSAQKEYILDENFFPPYYGRCNDLGMPYFTRV